MHRLPAAAGHPHDQRVVAVHDPGPAIRNVAAIRPGSACPERLVRVLEGETLDKEFELLPTKLVVGRRRPPG